MKRSNRYLSVKKNVNEHNLDNTSHIKVFPFLINNNIEKSKSLKISVFLNAEQQKKKLSSQGKTSFTFPHYFGKPIKFIFITEGFDLKSLERIKEEKDLNVEFKTLTEILENDLKTFLKSLKKDTFDFSPIICINSKSVFKSTKLDHKQIKILEKKCFIVNVNQGIEDFIAELKKMQQKNCIVKPDPQGNINVVIGKTDFSLEELIQNYLSFLEHVKSVRPKNWKGIFIKKISASTSMGPGIKINF